MGKVFLEEKKQVHEVMSCGEPMCTYISRVHKKGMGQEGVEGRGQGGEAGEISSPAWPEACRL